MSRNTVGTAMVVSGYVISLAALTRFNRMVRRRELHTLAVLEASAATLAVGFTLKRRTLAALSNVFWLLAFPAWYAWRGARRR